MNKIKLFLNNSFVDTTYDNVSVVIVSRPPLLYQTKNGPTPAFNPVIASALVTALIGLLIALGLYLYQRNNKQREEETEKSSHAPVE